MTFVSRLHESGLVLTEESVRDEAGLLRALKQIDDRLVLWAPDVMSPYWRVLRRNGGDRPAEPVLVWMDDDGTPRPLSSGILEAVQRIRQGARNRGPSVDERNAQLKQDVRAQRDRDREALHDEYAPQLERGRTSVSLGARNRVPYWLRKSRGGYAE